MTPSAKAYPRPARRKPFPLILQQLLRPSVRLKTTLYTLSLLIILLVFIALNAGAQLSKPPYPQPSDPSKVAISDSLADTGEAVEVAQGKDAHLVEGEIQRSFEEPDFELLSGLQPSQIGCDVPLLKDEGEVGHGDEGVLVFLGIFSAADKKERRDLLRRVIIPDFPPHLITVKFILGSPPLPDNPVSREAVDRSMYLREINAEMKEHGDMVMLPIIDNIDSGKTHEYFKWVAKTFSGEGRIKGRPRFVMKADDDTILVMPNIISAFKDLDCSKNIYWGTSAGRSHYFSEYFRGLAYCLSWPLVSWIGNAAMPHAHISKIEDARTGQWLRSLDPVTDPVKRIDMGWTMGDWNQLDITVETVALHWIKLDEWVTEQHDHLLEVWHTAGRGFTPEGGVPPKQSIAKGRVLPDGVAKEHERQKELGWDVSGNIETD